MPWEHCGRQITDDQKCPDCGTTKPSWTTKLDKTRLFVLSGDDFPGDADAQQGTLEDAADDGSPFCEECNKAANIQDGEAEDEDEEPDEDDTPQDGDAQAETLETAADSGSPFCEECNKKANEPGEAA